MSNILNFIAQNHFPSLVMQYRDIYIRNYPQDSPYFNSLSINFYMAIINYFPQDSIKYQSEIDEIVFQLRRKGSQQQLVRMQICQIGLYMRTNLSKAQQISLSTRASSGSINKEVQTLLDQVSGYVSILSHQFDNASTYFAESHMIIFEAVCKLCSGRSSELISLKERSIRQNIQSLLGLKLGSEKLISQNDANEVIGQIYLLSQYYSMSNKNYNSIIKLQSEILNKLENNFCIQEAFQWILQKYLKRTCLNLINKYSDIELSYLSELIKLDEDLLKKQVLQLIEAGELNYIIDSEGFLLKKVKNQNSESLELLKTSNQFLKLIENQIQQK